MDDSVFVHEKALCETDSVGARTRVWAFAHLLPGAQVGTDCNICDHAFIEGGARLGNRVTVKNAVLVWDGVVVEDDVFLGPNMIFTNDLRPRATNKKARHELLETVVREGATVGANATILCGITIGPYAFVAAGAVVTRSVPGHALVAGTPARQCGWVCSCGEPLPATLACACGKRFRENADGLRHDAPRTAPDPGAASESRRKAG
jgi:UDP-2-acetamido-3-amino-2,3-dideoxy-glucuronate N-acetyltransferase